MWCSAENKNNMYKKQYLRNPCTLAFMNNNQHQEFMNKQTKTQEKLLRFSELLLERRWPKQEYVGYKEIIFDHGMVHHCTEPFNCDHCNAPCHCRAASPVCMVIQTSYLCHISPVWQPLLSFKSSWTSCNGPAFHPIPLRRNYVRAQV